MNNVAIITAAGSSTRMGENKNLIEIKGKELIYYTLSAFEKHGLIDEIVLIVAEEDVKIYEEIIKVNGFRKVKSVICGGLSRSDSVKNGLEYLKENDDTKSLNVLIHDGARPLVSKEVIDRVIGALDFSYAVIPVIPLKDTIKEVDSRFVLHTPDRKNYIRVQTPQGFNYDVLMASFEKIEDEVVYYDDAMVVELGGLSKVSYVEGEEKNIKVTTPVDIKIMELFMD